HACTEQRFDGTVIAKGGETAEQRSRPIGIPVVVITTTDAPRVGLLDLAARSEDAIRSRREPYALEGTGSAGAAEHREGVRGNATNDIARRAICKGSVDVDAVAGSSRDVLDRQRQHSGEAP